MQMVRAVGEVGEQLISETNTLPNLNKTPGRSSFSWPSDQLLNEFMKPSTVASRFTEYEVNERLRNSLNAYGLKKTSFEFAILNEASLMGYEMKSKGFLKLFDDSVRNKQIAYIIQAPSGSKFEGLIPQEILLVIVPNVKHIILDQLQWIIAGAALFTLILIAAFYVTVSALLRQKS